MKRLATGRPWLCLPVAALAGTPPLSVSADARFDPPGRAEPGNDRVLSLQAAGDDAR